MTIHRREFLGAGLALAGAGLAGCAGTGPDYSWTTVLDGTRIPVGWTALGQGNWSLVDGTLQGKGGKLGYLVSAESYTDFEVRAEFWADEDCNSGIFLRCQDRGKVGADNAYEVNIFDKRPDPKYGTGAIVDVAPVAPMPKAANRWNTYHIIALREQLTVVLNDRKTVDLRDYKFKRGPLALQSAGGTVRFRKLEIRAL